MLNHRFVGYQTVSDLNLRSADCLCYKKLPSFEDIWFNHRKIIIYIFYCLIRLGLRVSIWDNGFMRATLVLVPDVGDELCWRQVWDVIGFGYFCHQHLLNVFVGGRFNSITNIQKLSSTWSRQHHDVTNITVAFCSNQLKIF